MVCVTTTGLAQLVIQSDSAKMPADETFIFVPLYKSFSTWADVSPNLSSTKL